MACTKQLLVKFTDSVCIIKKIKQVKSNENVHKIYIYIYTSTALNSNNANIFD